MVILLPAVEALYGLFIVVSFSITRRQKRLFRFAYAISSLSDVVFSFMYRESVRDSALLTRP
jgi:hypothetical protein